jgi:hypothetical protein
LKRALDHVTIDGMNQLKFRIFSLLLCLSWFCSMISPVTETSANSIASQPKQIRFLGLNTYFTGLERLTRDGDDGVASLISSSRAMGTEWAREELSWGNIERSGKNRWDWNPFDRHLRSMAEQGYGIVGMLLTTPRWARVSDCAARMERYASVGVRAADFWCPPADMNDFADYVRKVVERYDGDGIDDAPGSPRIAVWQIGNEPNAWETWPGTPAEYGALLVAGYQAAKQADPSAVVVSGGLYVFDGGWNDGRGHRDGLAFMQDAIAAVPQAWNSFDALAIHPYMPDIAPDQANIVSRVSLWGRISTARQWLDARGGGNRPLWISEIGWSTCVASQSDCYAAAALDNEQASFDRERWPLASRPHASELDPESPQIAAFIGKNEDQQANYLVRSAVIAKALGVQHFSYFQYEDKFDGDAANFWEEASIVRTKAEGYGPKIAYGAYRTLSAQVGDAAFIGAGSLHTYAYNPANQRNPSARYHFRFVTADNVQIDVLWLSQGSQRVHVPIYEDRGAVLVSRDGAELALQKQQASVSVTISEQPIYIRQLLNPVLEVAPSDIVVLAERNAPAQIPQIQISNRGSGLLAWQATSSQPWAQPIVASGQGYFSSLPIRVDPSGLPLGEHHAQIQIVHGNQSKTVLVRLRIVDRLWHTYFPRAAKAP